MDALAASGNEMTLTRFAERLPDPALREQARRRLVRIHVALSPFPEVREAAAVVEDTVVQKWTPDFGPARKVVDDACSAMKRSRTE
jgi:hypothetical protein